MRRVTISASSPLSARAAAAVADAGGNAVDAAIAATIVAVCTEPGIVAPGAGGFFTIWPPDGDPLVIDGYLAMPGRSGAAASGFGDRVFMEYGGGMETLVGPASVAVPGLWAALGEASERFGEAEWAALVAPAIAIVADGFPLPGVSEAYLAYSHEPIFDHDPESFDALHHPDGRRLADGDIVRIAGLADSLRLVAAEGPESFYTGTIAERLTGLMADAGGHVAAEDLTAYQALDRTPITVDLGGWTVATNPGPAIGGAVTAALLMLMDATGLDATTAEGGRRLAEVQRAVLRHRAAHLDIATDRIPAVERLLSEAGDYLRFLESPSTVNVSAVDNAGLACAITTSAGYGSGVMIPGTGLWLNNSLGEVELHPEEGLEALPAGARLPSNMAPTVARRPDGAVLAVGTPGASRITTALSQVLFNFVSLGMSVSDAVAHPRLHVEVFEGRPTIACEPGVPIAAFDDLALRRFPDLSMYFGGVGLALWDPGAGLFGAADPRRSGAVATGGV